MLGGMLVTLHNLYFFHQLMERMRGAIQDGNLAVLRTKVLSECEGRA
jgi:tRNA-guanine family transglycosylase